MAIDTDQGIYPGFDQGTGPMREVLFLRSFKPERIGNDGQPQGGCLKAFLQHDLQRVLDVIPMIGADDENSQVTLAPVIPVREMDQPDGRGVNRIVNGHECRRVGDW